MDLNHIKGIGEKTTSCLHNVDIYSVEDQLLTRLWMNLWNGKIGL